MQTVQEMARRVARLAYQQRKYYRYNTQIVKTQTTRDPEEEKEEARRHGYYTFMEFQLLLLKSIVSKDAWQESKLPRIQEAFAKKIPLPPIFVEELRPGKYSITNGIHRYHASLKAGFTHIPAFLVRMVQAPELKQESKTFKAGDWVRLTPPISGLDWGYVRQRVSSDLYEVIGGNASGSDYVGDLPAFNLEPTPRVPRKVQNHILSHWMLNLD